MQKSLPPLAATLGLLGVLFLTALFHAAFAGDARSERVKTFSQLTTLPGPAFSAAEPSFRHPLSRADNSPFMATPSASALTLTLGKRP